MDTDTTPADPEPGSCMSWSETPDSAPNNMISLHICDGTGTLAAAQLEWLREGVHRCAALVCPAPVDLHDVRIDILDDTAMTLLHQQHKQIDSTTDVLTFDLRESADQPLDVDLAICLDVARHQGSSRGHDVVRELLLYVVHGLLHCVGYDDTDAASADEMHTREDEILAAIGLAKIYGSLAAPGEATP